MEAVYDQEGIMSLTICNPDEKLKRRLWWGHGYLFDLDKAILQASSNYFFFSSNIGSTAIEEIDYPHSKQGKQQEDWYWVETALEYPTTSRSLLKNEKKWLHEAGSKRWFS